MTPTPEEPGNAITEWAGWKCDVCGFCGLNPAIDIFTQGCGCGTGKGKWRFFKDLSPYCAPASKPKPEVCPQCSPCEEATGKSTGYVCTCECHGGFCRVPQEWKCPKCGRADCTSRDSTGLCGSGEYFDPEYPHRLNCEVLSLTPQPQSPEPPRQEEQGKQADFDTWGCDCLPEKSCEEHTVRKKKCAKCDISWNGKTKKWVCEKCNHEWTSISSPPPQPPEPTSSQAGEKKDSIPDNFSLISEIYAASKFIVEHGGTTWHSRTRLKDAIEAYAAGFSAGQEELSALKKERDELVEALEKCVVAGQVFFDWWKETSDCVACEGEYEAGEGIEHSPGCWAEMVINTTIDAREVLAKADKEKK